MTIIKHQFQSSDFYYPNWDINYLFIGTFNPISGEKVNYYYGRKRNQTWKILSSIFGEELHPDNSNFFERIKFHGIACMDMIDYIDPNKTDIAFINGKGYSDNKIINKKVSRKYNTKLILKIIKNNPDIKVFSTWGKGSQLDEWKIETQKIKNLVSLNSPSMVARVPQGVSKFQSMLENWSNNVNYTQSKT